LSYRRALNDIRGLSKKIENYHLCVKVIGIQRYLECVVQGERKVDSSVAIAKFHFGSGPYKARCLRKWAKDYIKERRLPESNQGKHQKVVPFIIDEDFRDACLTFLRSQKVEELNAAVFVKGLKERIFPDVYGFSATVTERTARNWMEALGFEYKRMSKSCYVDGHERDDVVEYRKEFLKKMEEYEKLMPEYFGEDMENIKEPNLLEGQKKHILVVHDESAFQAHDASTHNWIESGKTVLRKKGGLTFLMKKTKKIWRKK